MKAVLGVIAVTVGLFTLLPVGAVQARSGELDRSFGDPSTPGRSLLGGPATEIRSAWASPMIGLPDGSVLSVVNVRMARLELSSALVKLRPDGESDPDFGRNGSVSFPALDGTLISPSHLAVQGGKTVVLGQGTRGRQGTLFIHRRDSKTGAWDRAFGTGGHTALTIGNYLPKDAEYRFDPDALEIDSTGRIYVAGSVGYSNGTGVVVRLKQDGRIDRGFGTDGVLINKGGHCNTIGDLEVTSDRLYLLGERCLERFDLRGRPDLGFKQENFINRGWLESLMKSPAGDIYVQYAHDYNQQLKIAKLKEDGDFDLSFGTNGYLTPECDGNGATSARIDGSGRFILVCVEATYDSPAVIGRLTPSGDPDLSFSDDGVVNLDFAGGWSLAGVMPGPAGALLLTGSGGSGDEQFPEVAKLRGDGRVDPDFGDPGAPLQAIMAPPDRILDTVTTTDGGTIAGGYTGLEAAFVRFRPGGRLDRDWGANGWLRLRPGTDGDGDQVRAVTRTASGGAVGCFESRPAVWIALVTPTGSLDPNFGSGGMFKVPGLRRCAGVAAMPDGSLLVGGTAEGWVPVVIRLKKSGGLDPAFGEFGRAFGARTDEPRNARFAFAGFQNGGAIISTRDRITRFTAAGARDPEFGRKGVVRIDLDRLLRPGESPQLAVGPGGSVFSAGHTVTGLTVIKLTKRGKTARWFGTRGTAYLPGPKKETQSEFKVQGDGKLVLASSVGSCFRFDGCRKEILIRRLNRSGKADRRFGPRGRRSLVTGVSSEASSLTLTRKGIVAGGFATTAARGDQMLLARLKR